jgi:hypothetical protein
MTNKIVNWERERERERERESGGLVESTEDITSTQTYL